MPSMSVRACLLVLVGSMLACNLGEQVRPAANSPSPVLTNTPVPVTASSVTPTAVAAASSTPAASATPAPPADAVLVDTFDQEVYPFKQNGNCSLGEAIWSVLTQKAQDACSLPVGGTTIYLPTGTYSLTDADNSPVSMPGVAQKDRLGLDPAGFPVISAKISILGNGSTIQRNGPHKFGIFQVFVRGDLELSDLTITGGDTTSPGASDNDGGAVEIMGGQLHFERVTLSGNHGGAGGALEVLAGSTATLTNSIVQGNISEQEGGGIDSSGTLTIKDSVISGNLSRSGIFGGGGIHSSGGTVSLDHSRVEGNTANEGGGIYNDGGTLNVTNGTIIAANHATEANAFAPHGGGGINSIAAAGDTAQVTISDSFILGNHAEGTTGGGIYNQAPLTVTNSVIAYNIGGAGGALYNALEGSGSISDSCIVQNKAVAVKPAGLGSGIESDSDTPFDASKNWWGSAAGPAGGDSVTRNVTFDGFLKSAPDLCVAPIPTPAITPVAP